MDRTTLAHKALTHWTKWLPNKVKALKAEGKLGEAIQGAASQAQRAMSDLMSQGYREHEAEEVVLPRYVLLPPEPEAKETPEERAELAKMERQYQKEMAG